MKVCGGTVGTSDTSGPHSKQQILAACAIVPGLIRPNVCHVVLVCPSPQAKAMAAAIAARKSNVTSLEHALRTAQQVAKNARLTHQRLKDEASQEYALTAEDKEHFQQMPDDRYAYGPFDSVVVMIVLPREGSLGRSIALRLHSHDGNYKD